MYKKIKKKCLSIYFEGYLVVCYFLFDFESWGIYFFFGCFFGFVSWLIV